MTVWRFMRVGTEVGRVELSADKLALLLPSGIPEDVARYLQSGVWCDPTTDETRQCRDLNVVGYWDYHLLGTGNAYLPWDTILREPPIAG